MEMEISPHLRLTALPCDALESPPLYVLPIIPFAKNVRMPSLTSFEPLRTTGFELERWNEGLHKLSIKRVVTGFAAVAFFVL